MDATKESLHETSRPLTSMTSWWARLMSVSPLLWLKFSDMSWPKVYPAPRGDIPHPPLSSGSDHNRSHIGPWERRRGVGETGERRRGGGERRGRVGRDTKGLEQNTNTHTQNLTRARFNSLLKLLPIPQQLNKTKCSQHKSSEGREITINNPKATWNRHWNTHRTSYKH